MLDKISESDLKPKGSRLSFMVPSNMTASYNMIVIDSLNYLRDKFAISTLSINILPSNDSNILNRLKVIDDLPAPVLPTIPIFSFGFILKSKLLNAGGRF